jgi:hypothetical protein
MDQFSATNTNFNKTQILFNSTNSANVYNGNPM